MSVLSVRQVTKEFGGLVALTDVTIDINKGKVIGLIGPNGAGKTTLFNIVSGFYTPNKGEVSFCGHRIDGLSPTKICHLGIGRTFQIVKPFPTLSVMDNLRVAAIYSQRWKEQNIKSKCVDIIEFTGLKEFSTSTASKLTLPFRKRLELARALAINPKLVLLDEVLAGLNPTEIEEGLRIIRKVVDIGITVFMIEHVMKAVMSVSDEVVVLHYGKVIARGTPQEVCQNRNVINAYLGGEKKCST